MKVEICGVLVVLALYNRLLRGFVIGLKFNPLDGRLDLMVDAGV